MCGITGFNWKDEKLLKKATDAIAHRGPDQYGYYTDESVSLGHRRLSIIDLSEKGRQPMSDATGDIQIIFNGEIYNYQDIRKELEGKYAFKSQSDTEVIIYAYKEWGVKCLNKFNGMWAFALYDKKQQKLILSRDRLGKKPLYYYWDGLKLMFGSELKTILTHGIKREIDPEAIDFYMTTGYIPAPLCIFKGCHKVEARQVIVFDLAKLTLDKGYYFDIPKYHPVHDKGALIEEGRALLKDATRLRLISDVPVGAFLSGGLDSSAVVASMAEFTDLHKLHTFSIGFEGTYDESEYMHCVKDFLHSKHHHEYYYEKDFAEMLGKISYYYDEPFADYSSFPTYAVSALARKHVTVVLSGDGGDEIFGGYTLHKAAARMKWVKAIPRWLRKLKLSLMPQIETLSFYGQMREALRLSLLKPEDFIAELGAELVHKPESFKKWSRTRLKEMLATCQGDLAEAVIRYDLYYNTLADNFLCKVDRASMANHIETRAPFLDYRFLELEAKIPIEWKTDFFHTKILLRDIIKGLVPDKIRKRGKKGFQPPIDEWIMKSEHRMRIGEALAKLSQIGLITDAQQTQAKQFLEKKQLITPERNVLIRIMLLHKWAEQWVEGYGK